MSTVLVILLALCSIFLYFAFSGVIGAPSGYYSLCLYNFYHGCLIKN